MKNAKYVLLIAAFLAGAAANACGKTTPGNANDGSLSKKRAKVAWLTDKTADAGQPKTNSASGKVQ